MAPLLLSNSLLQARSVASRTANRSSGAPSSFPLSRSRRRGYPYLCTILVEQNVSKIAHPVWLPLYNMPGHTPFVCEGGLQATGLPVSLYYSCGAKRFQDCAPGLVASVQHAWPHPFCVREGFTGNAETASSAASDMPR